MDQAVNANPVAALLQNRDKGGQRGVYSCCSANEFVIRAALRRARERDTVALIEATANQVNQDGGYTGMTPADFRAFLDRLAVQEQLPPQRVICGGDHLGPLTWRHLPEVQAMAHAEKLVESYVLAGFAKIHIDTSMRLADDDPETRLSDQVIARRGARLCAVAEEAFQTYRSSHPQAPAPVYVIGSEVPIPGGALENEDTVCVTTPADCRATLDAFHAAFEALGLGPAWERVIALVVQPGVEFADESVVEYDRPAAKALTGTLATWPGLVFEGHSTDYQSRERLREMVDDGIAILKVGPALTFALREGLFALEEIERELALLRPFPLSQFRSSLDRAMLSDDRHWAAYYSGGAAQRAYARAFSFSDRARYYLPVPQVAEAVDRLLSNLDRERVPLALLSQYLPRQYERVRAGTLSTRPADLLIDHIGDWIDDYLYATL